MRWNYDAKLKEFLRRVSKSEYSGEGATLDYRGDRTFVISVTCKSCNRTIELNKPSFRIFDYETICSSCMEGETRKLYDSESPSSKQTILEFSLEETNEQLLNMTLRDIGIPYKHVLAVYDGSHDYRYYELSQDCPFTSAWSICMVNCWHW